MTAGCMRLDNELTDPCFWDYYVSAESNVTTLLDLYRIC